MGLEITRQEAGAEDVYETLSARVDKLIGRPHKRPFLSSTGDHAAISELISRIDGLEKAIREIAAKVHEPTAAQGGRKQAEAE